MKNAILLFLGLGFIFSSCKKDEKTCPLNSTTIQGTYKLTSAMYKAPGANSYVNKLNEFYTPCELDNTFTLAANDTATLADLGVPCSNPPQTVSADYTLNGNTLTIGTTVATISAFNCNSIEITENDFRESGDQVKLTYT